MSQFTLQTFEEAITRYFFPIANEYGWTVTRCRDDAYEIRSPHCVLTVDFYQGQHTRSINLLLTPTNEALNNSVRTGIWPIAGHNGSPFEYIPWEQTAEGFLQEAEYMANLARKYCVPYLLGQKSDWEAVREYWQKESEKSLEKIKGYKFPPNVQKRWHLPPPEGADENC